MRTVVVSKIDDMSVNQIVSMMLHKGFKTLEDVIDAVNHVRVAIEHSLCWAEVVGGNYEHGLVFKDDYENLTFISMEHLLKEGCECARSKVSSIEPTKAERDKFFLDNRIAINETPNIEFLMEFPNRPPGITLFEVGEDGGVRFFGEWTVGITGDVVEGWRSGTYMRYELRELYHWLVKRGVGKD